METLFTLDPETTSTLIRASVYGMIGLAFWFIRQLLLQFKEMQKEITDAIHNNKHVELQLKHTDQRLDSVDFQLEKIQDCVTDISIAIKTPIQRRRKQLKKRKDLHDDDNS